MSDNRKIQSIKVQILDENGAEIDRIWLSTRTALKSLRIKQFFYFLSEISMKPLLFPGENSDWIKEKRGGSEKRV